MKSVRWMRALALLLTGVLLLVACGDGGDETPAPDATDGATDGGEETEAAGEIADEFVLGGTFTLSGPASFLGLLERSGIELAIEQFNKGECIVEMDPPQPCEGGGLQIGDQTVPIRFESYDDESDSRRAIDNVTRLVEQDGAMAVWGPRMNEAVTAAASILEPRGIIEICSICSSVTMTVGRDFGFDITDTGVLESHAMARFLLEDESVWEENGVDPSIFEGRTKTAIIGRDELYVVHGAHGWANMINGEYEGIVPEERYERYEEFDVDRDLVLYPFGTTDFSSHVQRLAELDPDIVLLDVYVIPDMLAIMAEMVNQGLDFQNGDIVLLGNDVFMLQDFVDAAAGEGMDMSNDFVWGWQEQNPGIENPELSGLFDEETLDRIEAYADAYETKFADNEDALALQGFARGTYDAAMWLFFAIEKAGTTDPAAIAEAWKDSTLNGLRGSGMEFFVNPDTGETTGQLFVSEYIMGVQDGSPFYTGIRYKDEIYIGPWVYGDELPAEATQ